MDSRIEAKISGAVQLLKAVFDESLHSVYLYGAAARGEWNPKTSLINLLLVLDSGDTTKWPEAADLLRRKLNKGFAVPLVLTENYIQSSLDVYPMEFLDIKLFHECLSGDDLFHDLDLKKDDLRLQAEREVKGKWVQLRQAALERGGNTSAMRELIAMSASSWHAVFQALLAIHDREVPAADDELVTAGAEIAGVDDSVFKEVALVQKGGTSLNRNAAWDLIQKTITEVDKLARYVDGWQEQIG
jgi:predicted nucleotidyltransferase